MLTWRKRNVTTCRTWTCLILIITKRLAGFGDVLLSNFEGCLRKQLDNLMTIVFSLFETSQSLFWASFGLVDLMAFELQGIKSFTRFWAMLMFGSYSVINIIVLLNMLIAMMSNSYQIISVSIMQCSFFRKC